MKALESIKERYLLFKAKNTGDSEAYGEIYDRYAERIYRFIFFKISHQNDSEDLTSEVFLKAWQYIKEGNNVKNINALLYSIARNSVIDYYRVEARKREYEEHNPIILEKTAGASINTANILIGRDNLLEAVKKLKDEYSEVLILRYFDDLSVAEISEIIGKTQNNTRVLVFRALEALKKTVGAKDDYDK
jgi:RNA polymerase sigma-70 factor (ECF subfamily)